MAPGWLAVDCSLLFQLFRDQIGAAWEKKTFLRYHCRRRPENPCIVFIRCCSCWFWLGLSPLGFSRNMLDLGTLILIYVMLGLGLNIQVGWLACWIWVALVLCDRCIYLRLAEPVFGFLILGKSANGWWHGGSVWFCWVSWCCVLRGDYLAIVTLGFGEIIRILLNNLTTITGGPNGISGIPKPITVWSGIFRRATEEGGQTFHEFSALVMTPTTKLFSCM